MNLLAQSIQEYLKEYHQNWVIADRFRPHTIYIIHTDPQKAEEYVRIITENQTITAFPENLSRVVETPYTETTLLPQITEAINHIEQQ